MPNGEHPVSAVALLSRILQVDSTNPPGNEGPVAEILEGRLAGAGLDTCVLTSPGGRPNLIARWGTPTPRPALVLVAHTDVVGAEPERWTHSPFGGEVAHGCVWGRGALDMKGIAVMHAEAAAAVAASGSAPGRELIVCAVADEEAGSEQGVQWLLRDHPAALGFRGDGPAPEVLGEGGFGLSGLLPAPVLPIVLGEKTALYLRATARGEPGHGSLPPLRQAPVMLGRFLQDIAGFGRPRVHPVMRDQLRTLSEAATWPTGAVLRALSGPGRNLIATALARPLRRRGVLGALVSDTVSPTKLEAGYKDNVVPGDAGATLDCRLLPDTDPDAFVARTARLGSRHGVEVAEVARTSGPVSRRGGLYEVLEGVTAASVAGAIVVPSLTTAVTDLRFFRQKGARAYGWTPLALTPELLGTIHGHDERVPVGDFERAVAGMTDAVARACV